MDFEVIANAGDDLCFQFVFAARNGAAQQDDPDGDGRKDDEEDAEHGDETSNCPPGRIGDDAEVGGVAQDEQETRDAREGIAGRPVFRLEDADAGQFDGRANRRVGEDFRAVADVDWQNRVAVQDVEGCAGHAWLGWETTCPQTRTMRP